MSPWLAVAVALALASPARAQRDPIAPQPGEGRNPAPVAEACLPGGTALAVLTADAAVAKVIRPLARNAADVTVAKPVITLDRPGAVGVCAQFQGFWADGAAGPAAALVQIFNANDSATPLAENGWRGERTGPAIEQQGIRAAAKFDRPGTYELLGVVSVRAGAPATSSARLAAEAKDALRIPFTVVLRGKGSLSGVVRDAAGAPIAGALVRAEAARAAGVVGGTNELPIDEPALLGETPDQASRLAPNTAVSGPDGAYRIELATGAYRVTAQARGFQAQWYNLKATAREADLVKLTVDQPHQTGVDFALAAASPAPQPGGRGKISGRVTDAAGAPIGGAAVAASSAPNAAGSSRAFSAVTGPEGNYELAVPAGKWLLMAKAPLFLGQWYRGKADAANADPVEVAGGAAVAGVDFALAAAPRATVSGLVRGKDGQPLAKAAVVAAKRPAATDPARGGGTNRGPVTFTDEAGAYTLVLEPGEWVIGAAPGNSLRPGSTVPNPVLWWNDKPRIEDADLLKLVDGDQVADINFQFK